MCERKRPEFADGLIVNYLLIDCDDGGGRPDHAPPDAVRTDRLSRRRGWQRVAAVAGVDGR